jgi:hypothetical protein
MVFKYVNCHRDLPVILGWIIWEVGVGIWSPVCPWFGYPIYTKIPDLGTPNDVCDFKIDGVIHDPLGNDLAIWTMQLLVERVSVYSSAFGVLKNRSEKARTPTIKSNANPVPWSSRLTEAQKTAFTFPGKFSMMVYPLSKTCGLQLWAGMEGTPEIPSMQHLKAEGPGQRSETALPTQSAFHLQPASGAHDGLVQHWMSISSPSHPVMSKSPPLSVHVAV